MMQLSHLRSAFGEGCDPGKNILIVSEPISTFTNGIRLQTNERGYFSSRPLQAPSFLNRSNNSQEGQKFRNRKLVKKSYQLRRMDSAPVPAIKKPLFSFGLIADVQYGDKDNGGYEGRVQRYREAPGKLETAIQAFNSRKQELSFVLTLGDIIDGNLTTEKTREDFDVVLKLLSELEVGAYHLLGNHCLALPREIVIEQLAMKGRFYQVDLAPGWSLVVLDTMDISVRWPEESQNFKAAAEVLKTRPLGDEYPNMNNWNGGIGSEQKAWLAEVISNAERDGTKLIVAAHHPLARGSCPPTHLLWNYEEMTSIIARSSAIVLFLCGHYHPGGYACVNKTHFVTLEAVLEAPPDTTAYGIAHVHETEIIIEGFGAVTSRRLALK